MFKVIQIQIIHFLIFSEKLIIKELEKVSKINYWINKVIE